MPRPNDLHRWCALIWHIRSAYNVRWWPRLQRSTRPKIQSFKLTFGETGPPEVIDSCMTYHDLVSRSSALDTVSAGA